MKKTYVKTLLICCLSIFLTQCEVEDGDPGSPGQFGSNGVDGIDGVDGVDGQSPTPIEEGTEYGSFTTTITGERSDGAAINATFEFPYTAISSFPNYAEIDETSAEFAIWKFHEIPGPPYQATFQFMELQIQDLGEETESMDFSIWLHDIPLIFEDLTFITLVEEYESTDTNVLNFEITNYSFDEETNQFLLSFSFDVDVSGDDRFNSLSITGEVDALLLQNAFLFGP